MYYVCVELPGVPWPPPNLLLNPSKMSESPWKYYAALRCGIAERTSQGLAYISIGLLFEIKQRVNMGAAPANTRFFCVYLMKSCKRKQWSCVRRLKYCAKQRYAWISRVFGFGWCKHTHSPPIQNVKFVVWMLFIDYTSTECSSSGCLFHSLFLQGTPNLMLLNRDQRGQRWAGDK